MPEQSQNKNSSGQPASQDAITTDASTKSSSPHPKGDHLEKAVARLKENNPQIKHSHIPQLITETIPKIMNILALILSFGLIAFISWDIFKGRDFLQNTLYMKYQFIVCLMFIAEYIYRFFITNDRLKFFFITLPFIIIAIPYLNLIQYYDYYVTPEVMHYLRFVPIIRGLVALIVLVNFVSKNIATTVFASYVLVLVPLVYICGLFFYVAEKAINPAIKNLWYALWWAGMNATTIGCDINPLTPTGMILGFLLSLLGIIMFPLFTVYLGDMIQTFKTKAGEEKL